MNDAIESPKNVRGWETYLIEAVFKLISENRNFIIEIRRIVTIELIYLWFREAYFVNQ
jgi:hypothetical protein